MKKAFRVLLCLLLLAGCAQTPPPTQYDVPVIALLDTGVSAAAIDSESLLPGWNYVLDSDDTEDRINHGTAVTSVILGCDSAGVEGLAKGNCLVVPLVVSDEVGSVSPETLAQSIRDSVDTHGANIINISLGIKKDMEAVREAVEYAQKQGALVVSAVGNEGSEDLYYPAAYDGVLGVGSHNKHLAESSFSQKNETVDLLAPGENIWLASKNGKTYGAKGTSYATGYVSAAAALVWQAQPNLRADEVAQNLLSSAQTVEDRLILDTAEASDSLSQA